MKHLSPGEADTLMAAFQNIMHLHDAPGQPVVASAEGDHGVDIICFRTPDDRWWPFEVRVTEEGFSVNAYVIDGEGALDRVIRGMTIDREGGRLDLDRAVTIIGTSLRNLHPVRMKICPAPGWHPWPKNEWS